MGSLVLSRGGIRIVGSNGQSRPFPFVTVGGESISAQKQILDKAEFNTYFGDWLHEITRDLDVHFQDYEITVMKLHNGILLVCSKGSTIYDSYEIEATEVNGNFGIVLRSKGIALETKAIDHPYVDSYNDSTLVDSMYDAVKDHFDKLGRLK